MGLCGAYLWKAIMVRSLKPSVKILLLVVLSVSYMACNRTRPFPTYAQRAYIEQQSDRQLPMTSPDLSEQGRSDLLIELKEKYGDGEWAQRPYEGVERWLLRLKEMIELNQDTILLAKEELQRLTQKRNWITTELQYLVKQNQVMKQKIREPERNLGDTDEAILALTVPFKVHLVRDGDTLFAISQRYYGTSKVMTEMMRWNQGWIRDEDNLIAGLGIVLFMEAATEKNPEVIERFLEQYQQGE